MSKVVLVTGGFDPLHSGHIAYFKAARDLGDHLIVGLNSDAWLTRKKGRPFMPFEERASIIKEIACVDEVIGFNDDDNSACAAIMQVLSTHSGTIVFANGGDRTNTTTPEYITYYTHPGIEFAFGIGGEDKKNSSSWILKDWSAPKVERSWGHYRELYKGKNFQVKELVINPHSKLSMQRHSYRSETWNLVSGDAYVNTSYTDPRHTITKRTLGIEDPLIIPAGTWHQGCNDSDSPAHIIEIWKGPTEKLNENDIERLD